MKRLRPGATPKRLALAERVLELRAEGKLWREIGAELGISRSYASELANDPEGLQSRARKDSYALPCPGWDGVPCGDERSGGEGPADMPMLCSACSHRQQHEEKKWTREEVISQFQIFARETGRSPAVSDIISLAPSQVDKFTVTRLAEAGRRGLPHYATVRALFGSWPAAVKASGLVPRPTGGAGHREPGARSPVRDRLVALLATGPKTSEELCTGASCSKAALYPLVHAGLVTREYHGKYGSIYRLVGPAPTPGRKIMGRQFIVLQRNGNGWIELGTTGALTEVHAIEKLAGEAGEYVAIDQRVFRPKPVREKTALGVVEEPDARDGSA